jgi:hypothetical protein
VRGHGSEKLLDSYVAERSPVIRHVIGVTDFITKALGTPSKLAQALRDVVIPVVSRLAPFQHEFVQRLSQLGIAYGGSPIVEGAGKRYWDDSIRGGQGLGSRFLMIVGDVTEASTIDAAKKLCEEFSAIVEFRLSPQQGVTLVRPDGYVAYDADGELDEASTLAEVRSILERNTK